MGRGGWLELNSCHVITAGSWRASFLFALFLCLGLSSTTFAAQTKATEIPVLLFGQKCSLRGPYSIDQLKAIHAISPEQMPIPVNATSAESLLKKVVNLKKGLLPSELESYREKLEKFLRSHTTFFEQLVDASQQNKLEPLQKPLHPYLKSAKRWDAALTKVDLKATSGAWNSKVQDELRVAFGETIEAHPEELFHRVIQQIKVTYECHFGEPDGGGIEVDAESAVD